MQASQTSVPSEQGENDDSVGNINPTIIDIPSLRDPQPFDHPEIDFAVNASGNSNNHRSKFSNRNFFVDVLFHAKEISATCNGGYSGVDIPLSVITYHRDTTSKLVVVSEDENVNRNINRNVNSNKIACLRL